LNRTKSRVQRVGGVRSFAWCGRGIRQEGVSMVWWWV